MTDPAGRPEPTGPTPVDVLLARARADLDRVTAVALDGELARGALVVDTRPVEQRRRFGELPGAVVVDRNVLEWRLDPASPHALAQVTGHDLRVVVVCQEGYSSSLAAQSLRWLGLARATDLEGGFEAWARWRRDGDVGHPTSDGAAPGE